MAERTYLSIGDVLGLLREEFPDVTISKIRFLESQGLLDPERTPSGYRKFYEDDVERLRWILRQQRENFLPLKVIKGRLEDDGVEEGALEDDDRTADAKAPRRAGGRKSSAGWVDEPQPSNHPAAAGRPVSGRRPSTALGEGAGEPSGLLVPPVATRAKKSGRHGSQKARPRQVPAKQAKPGGAGAQHMQQRLSAGQSGVSLTREELIQASGLNGDQLAELESYGLLFGDLLGGTLYYTEEALTVAYLAREFYVYGVEARHLRMYRSSADREAALFEQLIMPLLRQRNPESRQRAVEVVSELTRLGTALRESLLRQALRGHTGG